MPDRVVALVAAQNESGRIGPTVRAIRSVIPEVIVADDGSTDGTAEEARTAGASVIGSRRRWGKGAAMEAALSRAGPADTYAFLDADLGASAKEVQVLLEETASGRADLAIGVLPRIPGQGGFGMVRRLAGSVIRGLCGFRAEAPLSGQRVATGEVVDAVRPLAQGFGVEVGMTVDAVRLGFRVVEVPVAMEHSPPGGLAGFLHRGRQGKEMLAVAALRAVGLR